MADTIHALATAPGKSGVAVIRISGPNSSSILKALGGKLPDHRSSRVSTLTDSRGMVLDQALVLYFAKGGSFTGEETVELQLHGSIACIRLVLRAIDETGLSRMAEPGEFTRRALENERLDLIQVQGLADVIDAETEQQHRQAMRVFEGELSRRVLAWRADLIRAAALVEAVIDFAEEDVPHNVIPEVEDLIDRVLVSIGKELDGRHAAERVRSGYTIAIVGKPNTGKSTLINALTRSDAAIVSDIPGTTRDVIEVFLNIKGLPVRILDTAGLRETDDVVEKLGIDRAIKRASEADIRIFLYDTDQIPEWDLEVRESDIVLRNKIDLSSGETGISAKTGDGISELISRIAESLSESFGNAGLVSRERDYSILLKVSEDLKRLIRDLHDKPDEIIALELRSTTYILQNIIGGVDIDDVLDEVFSSFCIGK